jgi:hypothetical protein
MHPTTPAAPTMQVVVPPQTFQRALTLKGHMAEQAAAAFEPLFNDEHDYVGMLGLGDQLGLWTFLTRKARRLAATSCRSTAATANCWSPRCPAGCSR